MDRAELVSGLVAGSETAWREYVEHYGRVAYAAAARLGLSAEQRDDLLQDTCLIALESIHTLRNPGRLASWTFTIAYRRAIDLLRQQRPATSLDEIDPDEEPPALRDAPPDVVGALARLEETAELLDAMAQLDPRCRNLLQALYLEEPRPAYHRIAERERMPIGSIGPNRARCLAKLKSLLRELSNRTPGPSAGGTRGEGIP